MNMNTTRNENTSKTAQIVSLAIMTVLVALATIFITPSESAEFDYTQLPECLTDEGESAFDCYFDADSRGSGEGRSFWIEASDDGNTDNSIVHYVTE